jgi:hypothetical protein
MIALPSGNMARVNTAHKYSESRNASLKDDPSVNEQKQKSREK